MKKESVKKFDLEAAFKALDEIEIPAVEGGIKANKINLRERFNAKSAHEALIEDYYDVSSNEDLEEAQEEREGEVAQAKLARIEKIVDLDAETADDLLPSYVGKVIMQCPQCMTLFYKNPEDIEHSEENPDVVNINEVCQHCGNTSGYTLIGKVDSVSEDEADKYEAAENGEEIPAEENELNLSFEEPTEEVDAEGTGEAELSDDELAELNLELEEIPEEEPEEKKESLNTSEAQKDAEKGSELDTEHKSENVTLNEETTDESLNNSEAQKDAEKDSELKTENSSENLTLNEEVITEEVDKDLDKKLKLHNDYIEYLKNLINQDEDALKNCDNEEVKAAIQRHLDSLNADLEAALPDALKDNVEPEAPIEDVSAEAVEAPVEETETVAVEAEEIPTNEEKVDEQLTEEAADDDVAEEAVAEEKANNQEVDYVDYKHSYCHILAPKLKALNYLVNVRKANAGLVKGYIKKLLNNPEVKWTDKEKDFLKNIEAKEDTKDIYNYVKNSIEKAKTIKVKVDENGELVESFDGCLYEVLTESLNNSEVQKEAEKSELKTENESENLTLNEEIDPEIESIINSWNIDEVQEDLSLEECNKAVLKEDDEEPVEEPEAPVNDTEEPKEEPVEVVTTVEEIKDIATEVANEVATPVDTEEEAEAQQEEIKEIVDEVVEDKLEEAKPEEAEEEAPVEEIEETEEVVDECNKKPADGEPINEASDAGLDKLLDSEEFKTPISEAEVEAIIDEAEAEEPVKEEFNPDDIEELDEASLNSHITEYLKEVYSNVDSFKVTNCKLTEKLVIEGNIKFNSGKTKLTVFEFLPAYGEGKLFFEGINKEFSEDKAFKLNCSINQETKTLLTESIEYRYSINESLVEGLK